MAMQCDESVDQDQGAQNQRIGDDERNRTPTLSPCCDIEEALEEDALPNILQNPELPITEPWFHGNNFPSIIPTWPHTSLAWVSWVERMKSQFETSWTRWNISDAIALSINIPKCCPSYLYTFLSFWSSDLNCFIFPWGMMGPTLLDVAMITGLPIVGRELPEFYNRQEELGSLPLTKKNCQWNAFTAEFKQATDVATVAEHKAFLLYWLCRYIACVGSKSVVGTYSRYVDAIMSCDEPISLGRFFLGLLFQGINRSLKKLMRGNNPSTKMTGPWWFLQMWIHLYFPDLFTYIPAPLPSAFHISPGHNLRYAPSYAMTEKEVFKYIFQRRPQVNDFYPYHVQLGWPDVLRQPPNTNSEEELKKIASHWNSILNPHPLMVGNKLGAIKKNPIMVEFYWPQCLARQLGCRQGIPRPTLAYSDLELVAGNPISDLQIKEIGKRREMFQNWLPFKINPCQGAENMIWWESVCGEILRQGLNTYLTKIPGPAQENVAVLYIQSLDGQAYRNIFEGRG